MVTRRARRSPFLFVVTQKRPHNFLVMSFVLISVYSKNFYKKNQPKIWTDYNFSSES